MRSLNAALAAVPGLQVIGRHTVGSESLDEAAFLEADALLINGEGTLHHSTARAMLLLAMLDEAKRMGKRVLLVNALFQQYEGPEDILANLALLTVREPRSAAFARRFGGRPLVLLDSAADPAFLGLGTPRPLRHGTVIGGAHANGLLKSPFAGIAGDTLAMTDARFEDIVATLRQAELYLTAQHHGVYAAALAGCPFIATPSNSHKIESFINWTGLPIPICLRQDEIESAMAFARRNPSIYVELQDFLRSQSVLTAAMIAEALR
ncbi:MAG: Uncharacterized protein FD162_465 [Rhodobacteraceae bacterium]|nr:MAG: Uncharacterized protein FD162_465 [Paracoccaceae bacterium]